MPVHSAGPLFDRLDWRDPISGTPLEPIVNARTPAGVPISGALRIKGTDFGYPIVDSVVRLTPELAYQHKEWLLMMSLSPPEWHSQYQLFQTVASVDSFGWQWTWNANMRTEADLKMRVLEKFNFPAQGFHGAIVLDAGAGAGDQSQFMIKLGAEVVSIDLSSAIEVVARKLRMNSGWVGVQADVMSLPFGASQFDVIYCEGVIQHTADSSKTVNELLRTLKSGGHLMAAHYVRLPVTTVWKRLKRAVTTRYYDGVRTRLSSLDRFKLLFLTGLLSTINYVPAFGWILRRLGLVHYYDLMPDFKTTWTNTYDYYGGHSYQRFITPDQFYDYFEQQGNKIEFIYRNGGNVQVKKLGESS